MKDSFILLIQFFYSTFCYSTFYKKFAMWYHVLQQSRNHKKYFDFFLTHEICKQLFSVQKYVSIFQIRQKSVWVLWDRPPPCQSPPLPPRGWVHTVLFVETEQQGNIMEHQVVMDVKVFFGAASERTMCIPVDLVVIVLWTKIKETNAVIADCVNVSEQEWRKKVIK